MPKFLFWNLNKSERRDLVCRLARLENVDVIILAESALHTARFLEEINDAPQHFHYVPGECGHISLFTRFQPSLFPAILESHRISIRRLDLPARAKVTVVSAHLPSKQAVRRRRPDLRIGPTQKLSIIHTLLSHVCASKARYLPSGDGSGDTIHCGRPLSSNFCTLPSSVMCKML